MADREYINRSERFHFTHMDLYPRNILVKATEDTSVEITGILDWNNAMFAPKYTACRALFWLWEGKDEMDETDEYEGLKEPRTPELQEIKVLFERLVGHDFLMYAYREEYSLLRRMFVVLQIGLGYSHPYNELEATLDHWAELGRCMMLQEAACEVEFIREVKKILLDKHDGYLPSVCICTFHQKLVVHATATCWPGLTRTSPAAFAAASFLYLSALP